VLVAGAIPEQTPCMDTVPCPNCRKQNDLGDRICIHCGRPLDATPAYGPAASEASLSPSARLGPPETQREVVGVPPMPSGAPPLPPSASSQFVPSLRTAPASNGAATAGMVLGILGVVLFWLPVIGFIMAILAVVFGGFGLSRANLGGVGRGQAIAALVLGVLGIILPILVFAAILNLSHHIRQIQPSLAPQGRTIVSAVRSTFLTIPR
jgi:hypothetical protein